MGDMADYELGIAYNQQVHYERHKDADLVTQYEEGIIDENGVTYGNPNSFPARDMNIKASGKGECPECGSGTTKKIGQYGQFYGCVNYPTCKGSRKI